MIVSCRSHGQGIERLLFGQQAGARFQDVPPILRLSFVHPQEAIAHRHIKVWRPEICRTAELAVPGMREFVRQQVARVSVSIPGRKEIRYGAVFARLMMFKANAAEVIAQRKKEIVMVIMVRLKKLVRLAHKGTMGVD